MTLEEKCACPVGADYWHLGGCPRLGVPPLMMADGPHGLRKQEGPADNLGLSASEPAVCFPTASAAACSFDESLLREVGAALACEAREQGVSVVLGPGVNLKRDPRCGRNFEYFSEDPLLSGELGAAYVEGMQEAGVGASPKHFAANNQETYRLISDSVVDDRALRELYLEPFRRVVQRARPWTLMGAYNLLNGTYCTENAWLMRDVARGEWGFDGAMVADWGAQNDNGRSLPAGLDVVMPGPRRDYQADVATAVRAGRIEAAALDDAVRRVLELHERCEGARPPAEPLDVAARLALARRVAAESAVLLQNDGTLPFSPGATIAVIGAFAKRPRYQGAGSSKINPVALDNVWDALATAGARCIFAEGYDAVSGEATEEQLAEAEAAGAAADCALVVVGLPDAAESEGADRAHLRLPKGCDRLAERVCAANPRTAVAVQAGAPVELPWRAAAGAVLAVYLAGCQGGGALADIVLGAANPSGKLAETWPARLADVPCGEEGFPAPGRQARYRESIYIGYRYYDAAGVEPAFPFGHGLTYTAFAYRDLRVDPTAGAAGPGPDGTLGLDAPAFHVSLTVENTGPRAGAEAVQLYVAPCERESGAFKPPQQLAAFAKVRLEPGEARRVQLAVPRRAFAYWDAKAGAWQVEAGAWELRAAASSRDVRLTQKVHLAGAPAADDGAPEAYRRPRPGGFDDEAFRALYGRPFPKQIVPLRPYTANATVGDLKSSLIGRIVHAVLRHELKLFVRGDADLRDVAYRTFMDLPLRALAMSGMDMSVIDGIVDILNYRFIRGFRKLSRLKRPKSAAQAAASREG
ncbi:glycoside hydrolase family 3 C-terminal domain-containing protein [Arabiibacter massiliensis]|uniref:glycoside hydrolase family 3 C-terminal domain-containing protein n=1 Tax=Arabiibacter massiliensis TaxID=1870985 RepID=UPI0009BA6379|nr:glycoside hydrolase family 3 C-terminal domain-containing protein [Arabiibacter massiliensis]